jgi:hypothetical protein
VTLPPHQQAQIQSCLLKGDPMGAVRLLRDWTGWDTERAKIYVYDELRKLQPLDAPPVRPPRRRPPPNYDSGILAKIDLIEASLLEELKAAGKHIERLLAGDNYVAAFESKGAVLPDEKLPLLEVVHVCFPEVDLVAEEFKPVTADEMMRTVNECLQYEGDLGSGPQFTPQRRRQLASAIPQYWDCVWRIVQRDSTILACSADIFGHPVFWNYAYVLHSPIDQRCLIVAGLSSD